MYNLLRILKEDYPCDVVAVFASEEEVGCRGAKGAAFAVEPDMGVVLEGTTCNDLGKVPEALQVCNAGEGVCVSFMDGASIANRALFQEALAVAGKEKIPCQVKRSVTRRQRGRRDPAGAPGHPDGGAVRALPLHPQPLLRGQAVRRGEPVPAGAGAAEEPEIRRTIKESEGHV